MYGGKWYIYKFVSKVIAYPSLATFANIQPDDTNNPDSKSCYEPKQHQNVAIIVVPTETEKLEVKECQYSKGDK